MPAGRATPDAAGPLAPALRTLPNILLRQARSWGARPFVDCAGERWTHADAPDRAARMAGRFAAAGIARGERVAVMTGNSTAFLDTLVGCGWRGAVLVPINTASMGPQIGYYLGNSEAALLVIEHAYVERLADIDLASTSLRAIWIVGGDAVDLGPHPPLAGRASRAGPIAVLAWPGAADPVDAAPIHPGDPLAILYTSGTTGPSKGVIVPHAQYYWWGVNTVDVLGIDANDVLCTTMPLFHVNAFNTVVQAALTGARVAIEPRFSASGFWPAMQAHDATVIFVLGAMVPILLAQPTSAAERAHRVRIGLGPGVPEGPMAAFLERTGVPLIEGYGSTETNFTIATSIDRPRPGAMGWLRKGFSARVADADDNEVPDGTPGELLMRADDPYAFASGYFNMPEKTIEAWRNLWFHTGDRVVREPDGAWRFIDRIKDAIRRRGENVSSYEVEEVLLAHPQVAAVAAYPVKSELAEDEVMVALIARPGQTIVHAELAQWCASRLPRFAVPRYVDVLDDLPRTASGKIQKYLLRERGVTPSTWDREKGASRDGPARAAPGRDG
ncbi:MAG: ATP-dependent acyl-CoA ligase [Lautropia sp.]